MRRVFVRGLVVLGIGVAALVTTRASVPAETEPATGDPGTGSIVVRAVGDRDPRTGDPLPLAGALLRAFTDPSLTTPAGECTTDASGSCTIAALGAGTYFVAPAAAPADSAFTVVETVMTSVGGSQRYADAVVIDEADATARQFAYRRSNPALRARCGTRVTLLYDVSGSISADEAATMRRASIEFVEALARTPSSVAVVSFATDAPAAGNTNLALTSVRDASGVAVVEAAIASLTRPDGDARFTNWDAAFRSVAGQSDLVILFTDGNPTVHGVPAQHPPVLTGFDQVDAGILSANAVKADGVRVVAVGVGDLDAVARENLALVSGPVEDVDYAVTTFADVRSVFRTLADALCPGLRVPVPDPAGPAPVPLVPRLTG